MSMFARTLCGKRKKENGCNIGQAEGNKVGERCLRCPL